MDLTVFFTPRPSGAHHAHAVDTERPDHIWEARYDSARALARCFHDAAWISPEERDEIERGTCFRTGMPVLRISATQTRLEVMTFVQIRPVDMHEVNAATDSSEKPLR